MEKHAATLVAALLAALAAAVPAAAYTSTNPSSGPGNPLANQRWFVDWEWGMSQRQVLAYRAGGRHAEERLMMKIARNPQTKRFGSWTEAPRYEVSAYLRRMELADPGAMTFLYAYRFPHEGCAAKRRSWRGKYRRGYDAGGLHGAHAYREWIRAFAEGIGRHRVAVWLEPDGIGTLECLTRRGRRIRYGLYRYAISQLAKQPNTAIYLDGSASDWLEARDAAARLRRAGVMHPRVRGFFLNATHYDWTAKNVRYGDRIVRMLGGGKRYVVSTAVNGRGPYRLRRPKRYYNEQRCNPPGRALGPEPTVRTASRFADGYIWIGDPGRSGGTCHGGPPGGTWWPEYALGLAARAGWD